MTSGSAGRLAGRVAIVTGGAQGLGRAFATRLAEAGAGVAVADILGGSAGEAAAQIAAGTGASVTAYTTDVTDEDQVAAMVADVLEAFGRIDVLLNNAGGALFPSAPFETFDRDRWSRVLDVNLTGQWLCARAVVPHLRRQRSGKIINVTSTMVGRGYPVGLTPYIAAKAGVVGLTRALAHELGPDGITVNALAPGYTPVSTRKTVHSTDAAARLRERMIAEQCLPRTETPQDMCGTVEFLASADSDFVTGQVFNVDGGWVHG
jgi:3-oxoacyl-[acyl-carrier protein] reductase